MPGRMLVNTGEVSLALDTQVVLRWRCLFPRFSRLSGLPWQAASNRNRQDQSRDTECEPLRMRARRGVARRVPAFCHTRESDWGKVPYPSAFDLRIVIAGVSQQPMARHRYIRCHAPRRRGIQYAAAASRLIISASGILDHPLSRMMTAECV